MFLLNSNSLTTMTNSLGRLFQLLFCKNYNGNDISDTDTIPSVWTAGRDYTLSSIDPKLFESGKGNEESDVISKEISDQCAENDKLEEVKLNVHSLDELKGRKKPETNSNEVFVIKVDTNKSEPKKDQEKVILEDDSKPKDPVSTYLSIILILNLDLSMVYAEN